MTSVETVGVLPVVGGLVLMMNGLGVGGRVVQMSVNTQLPFIIEPLPKFMLQHVITELYETASAIIASLEHDPPLKKKRRDSHGVGAGLKGGENGTGVGGGTSGGTGEGDGIGVLQIST